MRDVKVRIRNQFGTVRVKCLHLWVCFCVTMAVCVCVTFRSVHVAIENANASHTHTIPVVLNQVYVAGSLVTRKRVYGILNAYALHEMYFDLR